MTAPAGPRRSLFATRRAWWRIAILLAIVAGALSIAYVHYVRQPGRSWQGEPPPMTTSQSTLAERLRADLTVLAVDIGERNLGNKPEGLERAAAWLEQRLAAAGLAVERQVYDVGGQACRNLVVEIPGGAKRDEIVVVGAHYDSVIGTVGANDNGTGVAALLETARVFAAAKPERTLRLVLFVNEEPPYFRTGSMGSLVYARACRARNDRIVAMLAYETIGYYTDAPDSQHFPVKALAGLYPSTGNFIAFVGLGDSAGLVRELVESFRRLAPFPCEGVSLPDGVPGAGWSDDWAFGQCGYPAAMATDTAPFRYPHYHEATDTIDRIAWDGYARAVDGLLAVVRERIGVAPPP